MSQSNVPYKNEALSSFMTSFSRGSILNEDGLTYSTVLKDKLLIALAIKQGVPNNLFFEIKNNAPFDDAQWADFLDINIRTLQRYKNEKNHVYKPLHSERIFELAEVISLGNTVFDTEEHFELWLNMPSVALGNAKPIDLLDSSYGKDLVLAELNRIEYGIFV